MNSKNKYSYEIDSAKVKINAMKYRKNVKKYNDKEIQNYICSEDQFDYCVCKNITI